jgi:hypothetical protein
MKKILTRLVSFGAVTFFATFMYTSAQTSYQSSYYYGNNTAVCTMDAYVCPDGTTVGRTGYNCQFVCQSVVNNSPSYTYTSGCYTYYYNGQTRTTSVVSYNCQTQTQTYYPVATTYTYPTYAHQSQANYYQNSDTTGIITATITTGSTTEIVIMEGMTTTMTTAIITITTTANPIQIPTRIPVTISMVV